MSSLKRPLSKREQEDLKKKDDLKRSAEVFSEFVQAFEKTTDPTKNFTTFVRGGVVLPGKGEESHAGSASDKIYNLKPKTSRHRSRSRSRSRERSPPSHHHHTPASSSSSKAAALLKKGKDKKKSNLEIFKEELKQIQQEREERKRLKDQIAKIESKLGTTVSLPPSQHAAFLDDDLRVFDGTYDLSGDSSSTNLYMGNIAPNITEEQLCDIFGRYGPIASVKIMYPRGEDREEVRAGRSTLCGFVAFMCRVDAERALMYLRGKDVMGFEMRLGWGKAVNIPTFPIYVPPGLAELLEPPPHSGLPFNAQPTPEDDARLPLDEDGPPLPPAELEEILSRSTVKVWQPQDRSLLGIIHRVIEFIVREGPIFEAMLMQREKGNPMYRFLFDNRCNEHVYYRWKLFSILQGDTPTQWRTKEFRMFEGGPMWMPPPLNPYTAGMPEHLVRHEGEERYVKENEGRRKKPVVEEAVPVKTGMSDEEQTLLDKILDGLEPSRDSIADAMVFCIDHAEHAETVIGKIRNSLGHPDDLPMKKVAKLFLISDILHNCSSVHVQNAWYYRNGFEHKFPYIFTQLKKSHRSIEGRLKAEQYKQRVMNCFRAWEDWALYPPKYLIKLQNVFLGLEPGDGSDVEEGSGIDGKPLPPEPVNLTAVPPPSLVPSYMDADVDGVPIDEDVDGAPLEEPAAADTKPAPVAFAPSRWETVDPEQVKAQAITTSKWDLVEGADGAPKESESSKAIQAKKLDDEVREKLREIEMRVMTYQDELESGKRKRTAGESMSSQVEKYRKSLMSSASTGKDTGSSSSRHREKRTSRSPPRSKRSRSRSPPPGSSRTREPDRKHGSATATSTSNRDRRDSRGAERRSRSRDRDRRHR
ncbi:U2 snRNP-associated SURP motif-containing protein-like [Paramacrobiotus metropolitanus]|uniref:U2 snRNP-associated SURP motif-containing protein-like n=1 Tax=Paramacrobiotus metropolitanus TaxID=2943436 RepID=UPI002445C916|nr:U2 snRNP-associated SURP motif-containing protein-like [Paramacrobiotus metropolitanus]